MGIIFSSLLFALSHQATGEINNGFETDWIYAVQTSWRTQQAGAGDVHMYHEQTGQLMGTLVDFEPDPGAIQDWGWESITFAYDSNGNARFYAARRMDIDPAEDPSTERYRDIEIAEFDANGNEVRKVQFADTFLGTSHLGTKVKVGCIRFSTYSGHAGSIFVSALTVANSYNPSKVYEIDLGLTTLKNTYTGPNSKDNPPRVDFNPNTGDMYVVGQFLNEPDKPLGNADLVQFAYASPGTNPGSYTTLIDGDVFARRDDIDPYTDPGWPHGRELVSIWHKPVCVVYRGTNHEDGRETIVVSSNWTVDSTPMPQNEFYLDQTDSDGNLVRRSTFYTNYAVFNAQLDRITGKIWMPRLYGYNTNKGLISYDVNDQVNSATAIGASKGYSDACSPGLAAMGSGTIANNGSQIINAVASLPIAQMPGSADHADCIGFENYPNIHVNDYHVDVTAAFSTHLDIALTRGQLHNKPVILSDDNSSSDNVPRVQLAIERTLEEGGANGLPGEHFEHYAGPDMHDNLGNLGVFIDGYDVLPQSSKDFLNWLATKVDTPTGPSTLTPGGKLTVSGTEFLWNGQPVRLVGYSWTGAMVTKMCDVDGYLDALADHGVNLTRPWCIEQWGGTGSGQPGFERMAWMPYEGYKTPDTSLTPPEHKFDLYDLNDQYFARVVEFVRKAAARGIVVQLTLFDRFGVKCTDVPGMYLDSPYYNPNNLQTFLNCAANGHLPFIDLAPAPIWNINEAFIERIAAELAGYGNVIYEIMNEPHNKWPKQDIVNWHEAVADTLVAALDNHQQSPTQISDTFTTNGTDRQAGDPLVGTITEIGNTTWEGESTAVFSANNFITNTTATHPRASVAVNPSAYGGEPLIVEADVNLTINNPWISIGFMSGTGTAFDNGEVWMNIRRDGRYNVFVKGTTHNLAQGQITVVEENFKKARIKYNPTTNIVSAWLDGNLLLDAYDLDTIPFTPSITHAGFTSYYGAGGFPSADMMIVDNFNFTVGDPPNITQQPASLLLHKNNNAQFAVMATSESSIRYQWQKDGVDMSEGGDISGTQTNTLQIATVTSVDEAEYRCVVSTIGGEVISDPATLTLTVLGDFDVDQDVDQEDFGHFQNCLNGSLVPQTDPDCLDALLDENEFVNQSDFVIFQNCMSGANKPADISCDD